MRITFYLCFFFSSRRRHTRLQGDWSSDVCSSDLARDGLPCTALAHLLEDNCHRKTRGDANSVQPMFPQNDLVLETLHSTYPAYAAYFDLGRYQVQIGRASCREGVESWLCDEACDR